MVSGRRAYWRVFVIWIDGSVEVDSQSFDSMNTENRFKCLLEAR